MEIPKMMMYTKKPRRKTNPIAVIIVIALILGGTLVIAPYLYEQLNLITADPGAQREEEAAACEVLLTSRVKWRWLRTNTMEGSQVTSVVATGDTVPPGAIAKGFGIDVMEQDTGFFARSPSPSTAHTLQIDVIDPQNNILGKQVGELDFDSWFVINHGEAHAQFKVTGLASGQTYTFRFHGTDDKGKHYVDSPQTISHFVTC